MALAGLRVIEFAGLAPVPYCGMILANFGASVLRIDKVNETHKVGLLFKCNFYFAECSK